MALMPQTGLFRCIQTDMVWSKSGQSVAFRVENNMESFKTIQPSLGFSSLSCNSLKKTDTSHIDYAGLGWKVGDKVIVAASPPTEDAVLAAEPLTKQDLVAYLASGCKPKEKWR